MANSLTIVILGKLVKDDTTVIQNNGKPSQTPVVVTGASHRVC